MGLYIRDDGVNELANRLAGLIGATKTQAVRQALEAQLKSLRTPEALQRRIVTLQAQARAVGIHPDRLDDKALMDELSGGL